MKTRRRLLWLGVGTLVTATLGGVALRASGIGPALSAYDARLAGAMRLGLDPGFARRIAADARKTPAKRAAYDRFLARLLAFRKPEVPADARAEILALAALAREAEGGLHRDWARGFDLQYEDQTEPG